MNSCYFGRMAASRQKRKWIEIGVHVIAWLLLLSLPYFLRPTEHHEPPIHNGDLPFRENSIFNIPDIVSHILLILLFYVNAQQLIPRFIYKRKYYSYLFVIVVLLLLFLLVLNIVFHTSYDGFLKIDALFFMPIFPFIVIISTSTAYKITRDKITADRRQQEKAFETVNTELSLLRSQVSPHFMFNVLNTIVSMARLQSPQLEPTVMQLSSLMRYMLYDANEEKVTVAKEIDYLQSYIDLQRKRFDDNLEFEAVFNIADPEILIEPMLLIPFVENAFKHGTNYVQTPSISIQLCATNTSIELLVKNTYHPHEISKADTTSGIGLQNVQRRLNLLYEGNHLLNITKTDDWFTILLHIKLPVT
jgi:two-component system, LytTR family, sensor kinase